MLRVVNLTVFVFSLLLPILSVSTASAETLSPTLIFTEVKVRTDTTNLLDYDEFIEIYNASEQPIDLADYNVEYFNTTTPPLTQQPIQKPLFEYLLDSKSQLTLAKQPIQIANSKQLPFSSLSDSGGRLRLVTSEGVIVDEIAWTNTQSTATTSGVYPSVVYQCNSSTALCNSNRSQSFLRSKTEDGTFVITDPIWQLGLPSPSSSELLDYPDSGSEPVPEIPPPDTLPNEEETPEKVVTCEGIVISELVPNPAGADTGKEFIELYNPTNEAISLTGCSLQTSSSTKKYALPDIVMQPSTYSSFMDSITELVLPNSAGGTVWLLSPSEELSSVVYPGSIDDDASWALIGTTWQISYTATPAAKNIPTPIKPCPAGQTRNLDTDRCQAPVVTAVATLAPCKVGQERNPETGHCRVVASAVSSLVSCKQGQERNPETNRCRNITTDSNLAPCDEGQERSPDTNRCRKIANNSGNTLAAVTDVPSATVNHPKWWLAVLAVTLAFGYAVYEWRRDISIQITNLVSKLKN
jgi:hypothetical protein